MYRDTAWPGGGRKRKADLEAELAAKALRTRKPDLGQAAVAGGKGHPKEDLVFSLLWGLRRPLPLFVPLPSFASITSIQASWREGAEGAGYVCGGGVGAAEGRRGGMAVHPFLCQACELLSSAIIPRQTLHAKRAAPRCITMLCLQARARVASWAPAAARC